MSIRPWKFRGEPLQCTVSESVSLSENDQTKWNKQFSFLWSSSLTMNYTRHWDLLLQWVNRWFDSAIWPAFVLTSAIRYTIKHRALTDRLFIGRAREGENSIAYLELKVSWSMSELTWHSTDKVSSPFVFITQIKREKHCSMIFVHCLSNRYESCSHSSIQTWRKEQK